MGWANERWVDQKQAEKIWADKGWADKFWVDQRWTDKGWADEKWADQGWVDERWAVKSYTMDSMVSERVKKAVIFVPTFCPVMIVGYNGTSLHKRKVGVSFYRHALFYTLLSIRRIVSGN